MKIEESEVWKQLSLLPLVTREAMIDQFKPQIELRFNCKIIDQPFINLGHINNPVLSVQNSIRNICYLKVFVPNS